MQVNELGLPGVFEIVPDRLTDQRGFFSETYNSAQLAKYGIDAVWVQDNHSLSRRAHVLRGLHLQLPPYAQRKLVRVIRGAIFDVVVDVRPGAATFRQWLSIEISSEAWNQVLVPEGMAHGYLTLLPETEVEYKVTAPYAPLHERTIRYNDPDIGIVWPLGDAEPILSPKDAAAPFLRDALGHLDPPASRSRETDR